MTLPYPAGTDSTYHFTVVHMFTTSDFGKTPGDIETPAVTNTETGIQFVVTGLSPVPVGWTKKSETPVTPGRPSGGSSGCGSGGGFGGGNNASTYAIAIREPEHGKVTSNRTNTGNGTTVTLTAVPNAGYVLDTLTVSDNQGREIQLTEKGNHQYSFTMPSRAVTVRAAFAPIPDDVEKPCDGGTDCPRLGFTDLNTAAWYHDPVDYVLRHKLMNGCSNGIFGPDNNLSRAQVAAILMRFYENIA